MHRSFKRGVIQGQRMNRKRQLEIPMDNIGPKKRGSIVFMDLRMVEIPMDVVMSEILARLPAKSLMRFKCVSKDWLSLICSRYFQNRFLTVPSRPPPRLHMCLSDGNESVLLSLAATTSSSSFVVDQKLTIPHMGCSTSIQNLRGFMCYTLRGGEPRIYNPITRQLLTLPESPAPREGEPRKFIVAYNYGHDLVSNQYIVVYSVAVFLKNSRKMKSEHSLFVLGGGGSWSKTDPNLPPYIPTKGGVCIDAVIYYLALTGRYNRGLVSFDIRSQDFNMIQVPHRDGDEDPNKFRNVSLIDNGGKVTIIDQTNLRRIDLWILEDFKSKKWSMKTLVLQHLVNSNRSYTIFNVKGTTDQNGKVFFIPNQLFSPFHILCCDLQSNDIRKIEIKGVPDHWLSKDGSDVNVSLMDHSENLELLEI